MLITAIQAKTAAEAQQQIRAVFAESDGFELRLDDWQSLDIAGLAQIRAACKKPLIFTLRRADQGGHYQGDEEGRLKMILRLAALAPDYIDIEHDVPQEFITGLKAAFPRILLISSYHDFNQTPDNLMAILEQIQRPGIAIYKVATMACSTLDALRMLLFIQEASQPVAGMCMGEAGEITRVLGKIVGNRLDYACVHESSSTPHGALPARVLHKIYHYPLLNSNTKIYGVLGDPIAKSRGYILHNQAIRLLNKNGVYVRLQIRQHELIEALKRCQALPFAGASVTMPLKEKVMHQLSEIDRDAKNIGAVNTLIVKGENWQGFNTDGLGAISALEMRGVLKHKKVVILGAGGAARAIAYIALQKGAQVTVLNRTFSRAQKLAQDLGCEAGHLDDLQKRESGHALINTLPLGEEITKILNPDDLKSYLLAMDIVYQPIQTPFLIMAKAAGCICIPGYEMYVGQALLQEQHWFQLSSTEAAQVQQLFLKFFTQ